MQNTKLKTVDEYISALPEQWRTTIETLRTTIKKAAPKAEESISYGMPTYKENGPVIFFAVWKSHIGLYLTGSTIAHFEKELKCYTSSKGTLQIPLENPLPIELIAEIVKFRVAENKEMTENKAASKAKKQ